MKSKHLIQDSGYSHAVDVVAYDGSDVVWEINVYDDGTYDRILGGKKYRKTMFGTPRV